MSFEKETKEANLRIYKINMEAEGYTYTAGNLGEQFFLKLKNEGVLSVAHCDNCNINFLPVRGFCIFCGNEVNKLVNVYLPGKIESYTFARIDSEGKEIKERIIAYITFPNVIGGLYHEVKAKNVRIGSKVVPLFKDKKERKGDLSDIAYFEVIE